MVRAAVLVVPLLTLLVVALEWNGIPGQPIRDSMAYYHAGRAAALSEPIYEETPTPGPHQFPGPRWRPYEYLYPPPLAAVLAILPQVDYRTFDRAWLILNLIAFWVFSASLARIARGRWSGAGTLEWGAATFFLPGAWLGIHFGNIEMVILALVALGLAVAPAAGFALALGAIIKVTPVWPLVVRSWREPRGTLPGGVLAFGICTMACLLVFGATDTVRLSLHWITAVMPTISQGQFWGESLAGLRSGQLRSVDYVGNLSVSFLPVQLAVLNGWSYAGGELPALVRAWLTTVSIAGPVAAAWLTRRRPVVLQAAVVFSAAILSGPIVRPYNVAPALLLVLAAARQERRESGSGLLHAGVSAG